jgi:23S rRNA A2030 N6-methylase RlmJ
VVILTTVVTLERKKPEFVLVDVASGFGLSFLGVAAVRTTKIEQKGINFLETFQGRRDKGQILCL